MLGRVCAFTGHRTIKKEHIKPLGSLLLRAINFAYNSGCRTFLTGGAVGFDTEAARAVVNFRISHPDVRLVSILPCVNQDERWSMSDKNNYYYLLGASDEVVYLYDEYVDGCLKERNLRLATDCDILIAYVSRTNSGAAQTVRMAEKQNKEIYNLYPTVEREVLG